jgi:DNA-binding Lrp family transcriptional regulator
MDRIDARLLAALQRDSSQSIAQLSDLAGLSPSACHRRVKLLEEAGLIAGYSARLDPQRLGYKLLAIVEITLTGQSREAMDRFETAVADYDDILECHLMSGQSDYYLRVAARDLDHYDRIHRECLSRLPGVSGMRSSFAIRQIKTWQGYPIGS